MLRSHSQHEYSTTHTHAFVNIRFRSPFKFIKFVAISTWATFAAPDQPVRFFRSGRYMFRYRFYSLCVCTLFSIDWHGPTETREKKSCSFIMLNSIKYRMAINSARLCMCTDQFAGGPEREKFDFCLPCDSSGASQKSWANQVAYSHISIVGAGMNEGAHEKLCVGCIGSLAEMGARRLFRLYDCSGCVYMAYGVCVLHVVHSGFMSLLCFKPKRKC